MNYYIATRLDRAADHNRLRDLLNARGHAITYDWTHHGSVQKDKPERIREVALAETSGVLRADVVVVLLPGGRGTHTELGMALASGKSVIVQADPVHGFFAADERTCAFYHHPLVRRAERIEDVVAMLTP